MHICIACWGIHLERDLLRVLRLQRAASKWASMSALDSVIEQGDGGGVRLLTVRIYPHSDANGLRRPAECQKPSGNQLEVQNCAWASHKSWEVNGRVGYMHTRAEHCERLVNGGKLVSNFQLTCQRHSIMHRRARKARKSNGRMERMDACAERCE